MQNLLAFFAVNGALVAANVIAAGVMLALGTLAKRFDEPLLYWAIGLVGVMCGVGFLMLLIRFISRLHR